MSKLLKKMSKSGYVLTITRKHELCLPLFTDSLSKSGRAGPFYWGVEKCLGVKLSIKPSLENVLDGMEHFGQLFLVLCQFSQITATVGHITLCISFE